MLTFDGDALDRLWLAEYVPELLAAERRRYPPIEALVARARRRAEVTPVPIPIDCVDGFTEAFYARPERSSIRRCGGPSRPGASSTGRVADRAVAHLRSDLDSGAWDGTRGHSQDPTRVPRCPKADRQPG